MWVRCWVPGEDALVELLLTLLSHLSIVLGVRVVGEVGGRGDVVVMVLEVLEVLEVEEHFKYLPGFRRTQPSGSLTGVICFGRRVLVSLCVLV